MSKYTAEQVRACILAYKNGDLNYCRSGIMDLLTGYATILDAEGDAGAVIGWVFQHDETGRMAFCENDGVNNPENFAANNPRHVLCGPAYTHPARSGVPELIEAARNASAILGHAYHTQITGQLAAARAGWLTCITPEKGCSGT